MSIREVSVIVCTHNRANMLTRLVRQLRAQDYPGVAFEIIVVDNRSTDHTRELVEALTAEPGAPLRYLYEPLPGATAARNCGARNARFPYLAYVDDDCTVQKDWLRAILSGFDFKATVVVVGGSIELKWGKYRRPRWFVSKLEKWEGSNRDLGSIPKILERDEHIPEGNMAIAKSAWAAGGKFLGMDQFGSRQIAASEVLTLLSILRRKGGHVAFVPEAVAQHHVGRVTIRWMIRRAFWQGVSDALLTRILRPRSSLHMTYGVCLNGGTTLFLLLMALGSFLVRSPGVAVYHIARATRRIGLLLGELRFFGNWTFLSSWLSKRPEEFEL